MTEDADMYDLSVCLRFVEICRGAETQRTCQLLFLFLVIWGHKNIQYDYLKSILDLQKAVEEVNILCLCGIFKSHRYLQGDRNTADISLSSWQFWYLFSDPERHRSGKHGLKVCRFQIFLYQKELKGAQHSGGDIQILEDFAHQREKESRHRL